MGISGRVQPNNDNGISISAPSSARRGSSAKSTPVTPRDSSRLSAASARRSGRRSSTGDLSISQRAIAKVQVKSRDDSSPIVLRKQHGQMVRQLSNESDESVKYVIDKQYKDFEKNLISEAASAMNNFPGPDAAGLKHLRPRKKLKVDLDKMTIITNHIVVGNKRDAADSAGMKRIGVTHVLNVAQQLPNSFPQSFIYHKINLLDSPETNIVDAYDEAVSFIRRVEELGGRVLVHCVSGVSRSVTIILMHLMGTYEIFLKHAYNHMKAVRPYIHPNDGFKLQLAQFEIEHLGQSSVTKNAGEDWNFFEWNRVKHGYGKQASVHDNVAMCLIL